ncbi:inactive hydroxysteroid dehydrogenase-like protein 1 [Gigantopelta aegis]|uniref:inactive hydroxysteroid dehydrogenase-like protein 1 n=1 Tax=Gigantopelta aegis TaxID=1735272 RepID=UPI001B88D9FC|nr:inactive hydroxysteroid dehydrogenase-like protein 1 [Gigantopelta aegis]
MAAIDSFEFLLKEILQVFSTGRDAFAILGAVYTASKAISISRCILTALNDHFLSRLRRQSDLKTKFGRWAVVTGSSEGIGKAYAQELASHGVNIILISRGERRLFKTAKEIEEQFHVETCCIAADFSKGMEIYAKVMKAIGDKEVGILVNNVGVMYDYPQLFLDVPAERLWQLIHINVAAATMMTHGLLPQMVQRKRGAVVMVSSGACSQITPQMTIYAATKSFLDYFARSLHYEYKSKGVLVQSLMPFYVATRMTQYSETLSCTNFFIPTASGYARSAVSTLGVSSRTSGFFPHTIMSWIANLVPEGMWMWGSSRLNEALRAQALHRLKQQSAGRLAQSASDQALDIIDSGTSTPS